MSVSIMSGTEAPSFHSRRLEAVDSFPPLKRYTQGRCGEFAEALYQLSGFPIHVVTTIDEAGAITCQPGLHAVVRHPDGRYIDVTGHMDEAQLFRGWQVWCTTGERLVIVPWVEGSKGWIVNRMVIDEARLYIVHERPELLHGIPNTAS